VRVKDFEMVEADASASSRSGPASRDADPRSTNDTPPTQRQRPQRFIPPERLVAYLERAFEIEITVKTLANWRSSGKGPRYISIAGRVRYDLRDIATWLQAQRRGTTGGSQP
jgi:hypothetical protein